MKKYLLGRVLRGLLSVIIVVVVVMVMIYSFLDRTLIFAKDPVWSKQKHNAKQAYQMQQWERYGYVDYVPYGDYLNSLLSDGTITQQQYASAIKFGNTPQSDSPEAAVFVEQFTQHYSARGYTVVRLDAVLRVGTKKYQEGGEPKLYAYRDVPLIRRVVQYFAGIITVDNIHNAPGILEQDRGLSFTWYDPVYGGKKFSPALMGYGTTHRYLLYFDNRFPYIHQNLVTVQLGQSYSVNKGVDIVTTMTEGQGSLVYSTVTYPSGQEHYSADDLHSAVYVPDSLAYGTVVVQQSFVDDYTGINTNKSGLSRLGYSFVIGLIAVLLSYVLAIPLGIAMARRKDRLTDHLGTAYIIFITAVPSLAYIFLFKALGGTLGLPTTFDTVNPNLLMYVLPVISLALPAVAGLMKWLRRYMIDHMNTDYVKFARSNGLSERKIFSDHVLKNAIIPIVHGIPASILGALIGAIITERVYVIPGAGNLLTTAINYYDNGVIVGVTLFYGLLSVASVILGDILISVMDPRISFSAKGR